MALRIFRILILLAINVAALLSFAPLWLMLKPLNPLHKGMVDRAVRLWARLSCLAMGIELQSKGKIRDCRGLFIVSNHLSYTDIVVMASLFSCVFVSKKEVRQWPLFGILSAMAGTIFVDRALRTSTIEAIKKGEKTLSMNKSIVLFPEATTSDGKDIKPFKSAFFVLPQKMGIPILPVAIGYYYTMTNRRCEYAPWHGDMNVLKHLWSLLGLRRVRAVVRFCEIIQANEISSSSRKELAALVEQRIKEAYYDNES